MPTINDTPPAAIQTELNALAQALNTAIPAKTDTNLLIATWNLRRFGSLTREWTADATDTPKRDLRGLRAICEIVSRYDVVAIQEVTGDLRALRDMMSFLGSNWSFLMTDITLGAAGNDERYVSLSYINFIPIIYQIGFFCRRLSRSPLTGFNFI